MQNTRKIIFYNIIIIMNLANLLTLLYFEIKFDPLNGLAESDIASIEFEIGDYKNNIFNITDKLTLKEKFIDELKILSKNAVLFKGKGKDRVFVTMGRIEINLKNGRSFFICIPRDLNFIVIDDLPVLSKMTSKTIYEKIYTFRK